MPVRTNRLRENKFENKKPDPKLHVNIILAQDLIHMEVEKHLEWSYPGDFTKNHWEGLPKEKPPGFFDHFCVSETWDMYRRCRAFPVEGFKLENKKQHPKEIHGISKENFFKNIPPGK